jgi:hypothetical protein
MTVCSAIGATFNRLNRNIARRYIASVNVKAKGVENTFKPGTPIVYRKLTTAGNMLPNRIRTALIEVIPEFLTAKKLSVAKPTTKQIYEKVAWK